MSQTKTRCTCVPCESPAYGVPDRDHCAACCGESLIEEYDHQCPVYEHRQMAVRQFGPVDSIQEAIDAIDEQVAEMPKADSAGRSHLARQRLSDWVGHQVAGLSDTRRRGT